MNCNNVVGKRLYEGSSQECSSNKRRRVDHSEYTWNQNSLLNILNLDCIRQIFALLSSKELLVMEQVEKGIKACTDGRWEQLAEKEGVNFDWAELANAQEPLSLYKARYRRGMALHSYIYARKGLLAAHREAYPSSTKRRTKEIFNRFKDTQNWSPCLWAYISNDLSKIVGRQLSFQGDVAFVIGSEEKAGDLLLKGLSNMANALNLLYQSNEVGPITIDQLNCARKNLESAIEQGAICASFLALNLYAPHAYDEQEDVLRKLAIMAADKGNCRALDEYLYSSTCAGPMIDQMDKEKRVYSQKHILWAKDELEEQDDNVEAEKHFYLGIKECGDHVSGHAWLIGAEIKKALKDWVMAEVYIDRAIAAFGEDIPTEAWDTRAKIKEKCGDIKEAIRSINEIFLACEALYSDRTAIYHAGNYFDEIYGRTWEEWKDTLADLEGILSENETFFLNAQSQQQ